MRQLAIKTPSTASPLTSLSGGNQQKVVIAKWLATRSRILVLYEPTFGVDIGAKTEIYSIMGDLASKGVGILMFSSDMPELISMSDRIICLRKGQDERRAAHRGGAERGRGPGPPLIGDNASTGGESMNDRERFLKIAAFERPGDPYDFHQWIWMEAIERWQKEGLPPEAHPMRVVSLGQDHTEFLPVVNGVRCARPYLNPPYLVSTVPPFPRTVVKDEAETQVVREEDGILYRVSKEQPERPSPVPRVPRPGQGHVEPVQEAPRPGKPGALARGLGPHRPDDHPVRS